MVQNKGAILFSRERNRDKIISCRQNVFLIMAVQWFSHAKPKICWCVRFMLLYMHIYSMFGESKS